MELRCAKCLIIYGMGSDIEVKPALTIHKGEANCAEHLAETIDSPVFGFRSRVRERFAKRFFKSPPIATERVAS